MWAGIVAKSGRRHQSGVAGTESRNARGGTCERTRTGVGAIRYGRHAANAAHRPVRGQACVPAMMPVIVVRFTISCTDEK